MQFSRGNCTVTFSFNDFSLNIFFFNDTATTEIYTLSLHDALPIFASESQPAHTTAPQAEQSTARRTITTRFRRRTPPGPTKHAPASHPNPNTLPTPRRRRPDRKSTRLNSSHQIISYAVFCLKKKTQ